MDRDRESLVPRLIGGVIALGGVWHLLAPWIMDYSDVRAAVLSDVAVGAAFVVCGAMLVIDPRLGWPIWACGLLGLWVVIAPNLLGDWTRGMVANEAIWSGLGTLGLVALLGINHRFRRAARPTPGGRAAA